MTTAPWSWAFAGCREPFNPNLSSTRPTAGRPPLPPGNGKLLSFVLVKARAGEDLKALCERIKKNTGLAAYTSQEFKDVTYNYYMKYTGIPINFGIAVALGFLIGTAIAGQTFYNFTLENLRYFGTLKAMGATNGILLRMILLAGPDGRRSGLWPWRRRGFSLRISAGRNGTLFPPDPGASLPVCRSDYVDHHLFRADQYPQGDAPRTGHCL